MYKNNVPADLRENNQSAVVSKDNHINNFRTVNLQYDYIHRSKVLNSLKIQ